MALYETLRSDPRTYTGSLAYGLAFPMAAADIIALALFGGDKLLGGLAGPAAGPMPVSDEERHAAESSMSSIFDR